MATITEAIAKLPTSSADDVATFLAREGIKGRRGSAYYCTFELAAHPGAVAFIMAFDNDGAYLELEAVDAS